jgi:hypothetical protein
MEAIPKERCRKTRWSFVGMTYAEVEDFGRKRLLGESGDPAYKEYADVYCNPSCCRPYHLQCLGGQCKWDPIKCSACLMYRDLVLGRLTFELDSQARCLYDSCYGKEVPCDADWATYPDQFRAMFPCTSEQR